jgi:pre-rRNA-processing protein IPI3
MLLQETILCATSSAATNAGPGLIAIHDIQTGGVLTSFKQTNASTHSTAVFQSKDTQGGFILASQPDKSILNVYNFQKVSINKYFQFFKINHLNQDQISLKIILPEKLSCIALDRRGDLCAGGTSTGRIYLWEVFRYIIYLLLKLTQGYRLLPAYYLIHGMLTIVRLTCCDSQMMGQH